MLLLLLLIGGVVMLGEKRLRLQLQKGGIKLLVRLVTPSLLRRVV